MNSACQRPVAPMVKLNSFDSPFSLVKVNLTLSPTPPEPPNAILVPLITLSVGKRPLSSSRFMVNLTEVLILTTPCIVEIFPASSEA